MSASAADGRLFFYPWCPADFLSATRGWPLVARGAYRELLDAQWDRGALPEKPDACRLLIGATPKEWRTAWPFVEPKFPVVDGVRRNPELEATRAEAHARRERRQAAGRKGNATRWPGFAARFDGGAA